MPSQPHLILVVACSLISAIAMFVVIKTAYEGVDTKSILFAVILMALVNGVEFLNIHPALQWTILAVVDFFILKKTIDCSVYFGAVAVAAWIGIQILFYEYLSGPLSDMLFPAAS